MTEIKNLDFWHYSTNSQPRKLYNLNFVIQEWTKEIGDSTSINIEYIKHDDRTKSRFIIQKVKDDGTFSETYPIVLRDVQLLEDTIKSVEMAIFTKSTATWYNHGKDFYELIEKGL
jgi:hypothetical protein